MDLTVPSLPALPGVPQLPALVVVFSTLPPLLPLVAFDVFLGSVVFVHVPLPVVDIVGAFMVGMEGLISKCCLWPPMYMRFMVFRLPRDQRSNPRVVWRPVLICRESCVSAGLMDSLVLMPLSSTRMRLTRRSHSI